MHRSVLNRLVLVVAVLSSAGCGADGSPALDDAATAVTSAPSAAPTVSVDGGPAAIPVPPAGSTVVEGPTPSEAVWPMPDLVGTGLQDAQDAIQALTDYGIPVTASHDASGAGRAQVSDRNWKVCDQSVAPGTTIGVGDRIDFGAVKLDESC